MLIWLQTEGGLLHNKSEAASSKQAAAKASVCRFKVLGAGPIYGPWPIWDLGVFADLRSGPIYGPWPIYGPSVGFCSPYMSQIYKFVQNQQNQKNETGHEMTSQWSKTGFDTTILHYFSIAIIWLCQKHSVYA